MNIRFPSLTSTLLLLLATFLATSNAQTSPTSGAQAAANAPQQAPQPTSRVPEGQALVLNAARQTAAHATIESKLRVRTDLLGQPLVGSGEYAQLRSSAGMLLRMELGIQAGEQATSVKQISDGRDLWEHWRIGTSERLNHVDLRRVAEAIKQSPAGSIAGATSANLASGGLPKLLSQLVENFEFGRAEVRSGKIGDVPVWFVQGVWLGERLALAAPQAVDGDKIVYEKLPVHLPHQIELVLGQQDLFPYRVTYLRYQNVDGQHVLKPAVTTEFFDVALDRTVDPAQFQFQRPTNISDADRTDAYIQSLGIELTPDVAMQPSAETSR